MPVLQKMEVDPSLVLMAVNRLIEQIPRVSGSGAGQVYASQELLKILDASFAAASQMKDEYVSQEHLFLALIRDKKGNTAAIVQSIRDR